MIDYGCAINIEQHIEQVLNIDDLPTGYRFLPNDAQLINCYLKKKVNGMDVPLNVIQDIDASEFYLKHPSRLVKKTWDERRYYFFIHRDNYFDGEIPKSKEVGNGVGVWKSYGDEEPIYDENDNILAYKIHVEYFSSQGNKGSKPSKLDKTGWSMKLWRLNTERRGNEKKEKWVLGKLRKWQKCSEN